MSNSLYQTLETMIEQLAIQSVTDAGVIPWAAPIPCFGDLSRSKVATLGLNPSLREFVNQSGIELWPPFRRFHTLHSLQLQSWSDINDQGLSHILDTCRNYFFANPYAWFKKLDLVVSGLNTSYYDRSRSACHLNIVPYATDPVWSRLSSRQQALLLDVGSKTLGLLLRDSLVRVLILNGSAVVDRFESVTGYRLEKEEKPEWSLLWKSGVRQGFAYTGVVDTISGIELQRELTVLGFNHSIQGTPGVDAIIKQSISDWIRTEAFHPRNTLSR